MLIAEKFEVPDSCPVDCKFQDDFRRFGKCAMCVRCPVLNCKLNGPSPYIGHTEPWRLCEPEGYRPDWAKEWQRFFKGEVDSPKLCL